VHTQCMVSQNDKKRGGGKGKRRRHWERWERVPLWERLIGGSLEKEKGDNFMRENRAKKKEKMYPRGKD